MSTIAILDYGVGNLRSVANAVAAAGATAIVTCDQNVAEEANGLIVPGVGAFPHVMERLVDCGLDLVVRNRASTGRPVFAICVGMQVLFERGFEYETVEGLGLIPGHVERIVPDGASLRLPHIAWAEIEPQPSVVGTMLDGLDAGQRRFYFLHSFSAVHVPESFVAASVNYGGKRLVAMVRHGSLWATQFHPEKSGPAGLTLLRNFVASCDARL